jgi:HNH endonuclease
MVTVSQTTRRATASHPSPAPLFDTPPDAGGSSSPVPSVDGSGDGDGGAGLGARVDSVLAELAAVVGELDPARLTGAHSKVLYASLVAVERLTNAGKTLLAPRIEASGIWRDEGYRNAPEMLGQVEGVPTGKARDTLSNGRRLLSLPGTEEALRKGELSAPKVTELTEAGVLDPGRETELLSGAAEAALGDVRERCRRSRASSAGADPIATFRRIRARRRFSSWTDADGAFCYQGSDTADRGAKILAQLGVVATRLRTARRSQPDYEGEPEGAVRADALFALITQRHPDTDKPLTPRPSAPAKPRSARGRGRAGTRTGTGSPKVPPSGPPLVDPDHDPDLDPPGGDNPTDAGDTGTDQPSEDSLTLIDRPPTCSVVIRVDADALERGYTEPGELCEIDNQGPIPVALARQMAVDSFRRYVFHRAGDIRAVSHIGRTINQVLRTALVFRDTTCVVPGCRESKGLEFDHIIPVAEDGPTELDNLALLCHHHHFLKTFEGWTLTRLGLDRNGKIEWEFSPPVPFGQEPGLGIDTPEANAEWHKQQREQDERRQDDRKSRGADPKKE